MDQDRSLVSNAGDVRQIREAKKVERRRRKQEIEDLQAILKLESGRRLVWRILEEAGVYRNSFSLEPGRTEFNEGKRFLGTWFSREIMLADPNALVGMMRDHMPKEPLKDEEEEPKDE